MNHDRAATVVDRRRLGEMVDGCREEAFRLETLPFYGVPGEATTAARYAAGELFPDPPQPTAWTGRVRQIAESGRRVPHVWLVSEPLTMYQRACVDWFYPHQIAAGRDTHVLTPGSPLAHEATEAGDYWMFDSTTVLLMRYDDTGAIRSRDLVEDAGELAYRIDLRDRLLAAAQPFRQWLAGWRQRVR